MKNLAKLVLTMASLLVVTTLVVLYSDGWRLNNLLNKSETESVTVVKTGMLAVRSVPEAAKVYLNGEAKTATDDTISSLTPGKYVLKVEKEGFETWKKEVTVFPELVTDITAVLVLKSPRLDPLTNTDVRAFALSSNQNNVAFLTSNHKKPGIWLLPMGGNPINIFRNSAHLFIPDNIYASPSLGEQIWWSPDDKEILVKMNKDGYLLYELNDQGNNKNLIPTSVTNVEKIFERWNQTWHEDFVKDKIESLKQELSPPEWIMNTLATIEVSWSPDDEKFFFTSTDEQNPELLNVIVYNSENPLPVGESRVNYPFEIRDTKTTKIYWYSDSYHLIIVEKDQGSDNMYRISLVRIDGTNKTEIYTGTLASDQAAPTPGGDKILVLTSLKDNSPNNLYGISLR